jgi:hypothetical protein
MSPHIAPCGHTGEPIFGSFVLCRRPECNVAPTKPEISCVVDPLSLPQSQRAPLDAAEQVWFDAEIARVRSDVAVYEATGSFSGVQPYEQAEVPFELPNVPPAAQNWTTINRRSVRVNYPIKSACINYDYDVTEIRAAMYARQFLDRREPIAAARAIMALRDDLMLLGYPGRQGKPSTCHGFYDHDDVSARKPILKPWNAAPARDILTDLLDACSAVAPYASAWKCPIVIRLPESAYKVASTTRYGSGRLTVLEELGLRPPTICIKTCIKIQPDWRLNSLGRMVSYVESPNVAAVIRSVPFEQLPVQVVVPSAAHPVLRYSTTIMMMLADGVHLKEPDAVSYWDGVTI